MTLDESAYSDITDPALVDEVTTAAYHGADIRPAWIGAHRPRTTVDGLSAICHWASVHYDYYLNFVKEYMTPDGNVMDIGCGAGQSTAMLARYSRLATGIDSDAEVIKFARCHNAMTGAIFVQGEFPEVAEPRWGFDYIFCIETLEHIPYDKQREFIEAALWRLAEGGLMFITTPNEQSSSAPHVGIWSREWTANVAGFLGDHVVKRGWFSNTQPVGMLDKESSHHAWVLR